MALLATVNDLCRLAAVDDVRGSQLPTIEIEFYHVAPEPTAVNGGRLALMDCPGPNEAGQGERLREVIRVHLGNASAVILVCNFTQLKTDAEAELQATIAEYAN